MTKKPININKSLIQNKLEYLYKNIAYLWNKTEFIKLLFLFTILIGFFFGYIKIERDSFQTFFYIMTGLYGIWFIFFEGEKTEQFLTDNFTKIIFSVVFLLLFFISGNYIELHKETLYIIGGLIAFWYGYKKYEREKLFSNINMFISNNGTNTFESTILRWYSGYVLYKESELNEKLYKSIEDIGLRYLINSIYEAENIEYVRNFLATTIYIFDNEIEYITGILLEQKEIFQSMPTSTIKQIEDNKKTFIEEIDYINSNHPKLKNNS